MLQSVDMKSHLELEEFGLKTTHHKHCNKSSKEITSSLVSSSQLQLSSVGFLHSHVLEVSTALKFRPFLTRLLITKPFLLSEPLMLLDLQQMTSKLLSKQAAAVASSAECVQAKGNGFAPPCQANLIFTLEHVRKLQKCPEHFCIGASLEISPDIWSLVANLLTALVDQVGNILKQAGS